MRIFSKFSLILLCLFFSQGLLVGENISLELRNNMQKKGAEWLLSKQAEDGSWLGQSKQPAFTALACMGLYDSPLREDKKIADKINQALDYVVAAAKEDGGIYGASKVAKQGDEEKKTAGKDGKPGGRAGGGGRPGGGGSAAYAVYNTSICLTALAKYNRPQDLEVCKKARNYLLDSQVSSDDPAALASAGGTGYAPRRMRADLSNTAWTLEALYVTEHLDKEPYSKDPAQGAKAELAWEKALQFVTMCQNLAETNQSAWVKSAPEEDRGGFIYCPEDALRAEENHEALRSYGSMTYAGLKSLIYAKVHPDDLRMKSAFEWIRKYYTLEENPGAGAAGYYYYLHLFAKTLELFQQQKIVDAKGKEHIWKQELLEALKDSQNDEGFWQNSKSGRWMESIPELSTAYSLMTLELIK